MRMILPWAPKADRRAAIAAARAEADQSARSAAHAKDVERDIRWLYQQNRWAGHIADTLGIPREDNGG